MDMTTTRVIGPFTVPAIGLGCMPLSGMPESKQWIINERDKAIGVVHAALDAGVRLLDTADIYAPTWNSVGHNEILVSEAVRTWSGTAAQKEEIAIAWHLATSPVAIPIPGASRKESILDSMTGLDVKLTAQEVELLNASLPANPPLADELVPQPPFRD
jgi:aryl-alcohol dehydrogenase-like predicted oxidoreductase